MLHQRGLHGLGDLTPSLSFVTSRGGMALQVGDTFTVTVTAPPNQPVWLQSSLSGSPIATSQVGSTDSSGRFSLSGTMGNGEIGTWYEHWFVGGSLFNGVTLMNSTSVGELNFTVSAAQAAPTTQPPVVSGSVLPFQVPTSAPTIPSWAWLAAAGAAAVLFLGGRR